MFRNSSFLKSGVLLVGVRIIRAQLLGVYTRAPGFFKLQMPKCLARAGASLDGGWAVLDG